MLFLLLPAIQRPSVYPAYICRHIFKHDPLQKFAQWPALVFANGQLASAVGHADRIIGRGALLVPSPTTRQVPTSSKYLQETCRCVLESSNMAISVHYSAGFPAARRSRLISGHNTRVSSNEDIRILESHLSKRSQ